MTPFKIRKRLKTLLGMGPSPTPQAPALPTYEVRFECPDGESYTVTAKEGDSLVLAAGRGPQPINTGCRTEPAGHAGWMSSQGRGVSPRQMVTRRRRRLTRVCRASALGVPDGHHRRGRGDRITNVLGEEIIDP